MFQHFDTLSNLSLSLRASCWFQNNLNTTATQTWCGGCCCTFLQLTPFSVGTGFHHRLFQAPLLSPAAALLSLPTEQSFSFTKQLLLRKQDVLKQPQPTSKSRGPGRQDLSASSCSSASLQIALSGAKMLPCAPGLEINPLL